MIALVTINCIIVWLHVFRVEQKSLRYSIHHQERAHHYNEQTQRARDRLRRRNDSSQMQDASISDIPVNTCEEIQLPLNAQKQSESITAEAVSAASELPAVSMDLRNNGTTSSMETIRLGKDENYYRHNDDRLRDSNDTKDTIEYTTESEDKASTIKAPPSVEEHEIVFGSHSDELGADNSTDLLDAPFVFKAMDNENDQNNTFLSLSADPKDEAEMPAIDLHEGQIAEASTMGSTLLHANLETKHHTDQDGHNDGAGKNPLAGADKQMNGSMNHSARQTDEIDSIHEIAEKSDSSDDPGKVNEERPRPIGSFSSHEPERAEAHVESQSNEIIQSATLEGTSAAISETTYSSVSWSLPPRKRPNGLSANGFPNSSNERRMSLDQQSSRSRMASLFRSFRKQERMQMKLKRTKQVAKLCFRYAVAFYINWVALTVSGVFVQRLKLLHSLSYLILTTFNCFQTIRVCQIFDPSFSSFGLFLVAGFTTPIQGLPNFIIYLGPLIWEETRKHFERQKQQQENARVLSATPQSEVSIIWQQAGTGIHRIGQISSALIQGVRSALVRSAESEAEFLSHSQEISGSTLSATRDKTSTDNILDPFASLEDWNESEDEDDIDIEEKETVGYGLSRQPSDDESVQS